MVIFGNSDWADMAHFYLTHDSPREVAAFTVDADHLSQTEHRGLPVVAFEEVGEHYPPEGFQMFPPISYKEEMSHFRTDRYNAAKQRGCILVSYVSSKATTWPDFECGDNCFILEDNTVQPSVKIGSNVVIWSGNHPGHHSEIKDPVTITSGVVLSGHCTIESYCFLGVNSTIRDEVTVARETLVGAATRIMGDTQEFDLYITDRTRPARVKNNELQSL